MRRFVARLIQKVRKGKANCDGLVACPAKGVLERFNISDFARVLSFFLLMLLSLPVFSEKDTDHHQPTESRSEPQIQRSAPRRTDNLYSCWE